jgi:PIF1-like helicase/Helix-turn-helix domain/Helicase
MFQTDSSNSIFQLAADFINNTSRHIFLTGKAGTGKTTFLKYIKDNTTKNAVIVAPTGVAAINAGGVTIHSFFQLPFGPFIPGINRGFSDNSDVSDKHSLFKNIRFNSDKRELLQELELLIIDEVSMVRADMLDAIDTILRHFRKKLHLPFGGIQVLYIGDMYQLPPVVANNEWDILQQYYQSPFFFSAKAIAEAPPLYIELKKIYRQNEQVFIDLLNRVRNNAVTPADFIVLNSHYAPEFNPPANDKYITLCTHNKKADTINANALFKLPGKTYQFTGTITGDFSDKAFPTEIDLQLKEGAQVMFIKNDSGAERKYYNGKLATVKSVRADEIIVIANNDNEELKLEKETWSNIRYSYEKETDSIKEVLLGSFTQYPIRLAWAITVHKSQGLTFDKAIIDAGASFAAGQVYVALSRCTSLTGIVLLSEILPSAIATDSRVIAFANKEAAAEELQNILETDQQQYLSDALIKLFDWQKITDCIRGWASLIPNNKLPDINTSLLLGSTLLEKVTEQSAVAEKFQQQLQRLLPEVQVTGNTLLLEERVNKAIVYFTRAIGQDLLLPLKTHRNTLQYSTKAKGYSKEVAAIESFLFQQLKKMTAIKYGTIVFCKDTALYKPYETGNTVPAENSRVKKTKPVKGSSPSESLVLFNEGKTIQEIASLRQLAESTVTGHLATFVKTGELDVQLLLTKEKIDQILPAVKEIGGHAITPIKEKLADEFSFSDIKIVLNYWHWLQEQIFNS